MLTKCYRFGKSAMKITAQIDGHSHMLCLFDWNIQQQREYEIYFFNCRKRRMRRRKRRPRRSPQLRPSPRSLWATWRITRRTPCTSSSSPDPHRLVHAHAFKRESLGEIFNFVPFQIPSISPFCLKLESWLKLHGIKYQVSSRIEQ